jgi:hypothetical protein
MHSDALAGVTAHHWRIGTLAAEHKHRQHIKTQTLGLATQTSRIRVPVLQLQQCLGRVSVGGEKTTTEHATTCTAHATKHWHLPGQLEVKCTEKKFKNAHRTYHLCLALFSHVSSAVPV